MRKEWAMKARIIGGLLALAALLSLSGCGAAAGQSETVYALSPEHDRVMSCQGKNVTEVFLLPEDSRTALVYGKALYYAPTEGGGSLTKLNLAAGQSEQWSLPDRDSAGMWMAADADGVYAWLRTGGENGIYRVNAEGWELLTRSGATPRWPAFAVGQGGLYFVSDESGDLVREDLAKDVRTVISEDTGYAKYIGVDSGRVYVSFVYCFSCDAQGGDRRVETLFYSGRELTPPVTDVERLSSAVAHGGWLYYCAPDGSGTQVRLMARRVSDGKTVDYGLVTADLFYPLESLFSFGEKSFVFCSGDGRDSEDYLYFSYVK